MSPLVLMSAPNGARRTRADHPKLPINPEELAEEAVAIADAGATLLHLHVRDDEGRHSLEPDLYRQAISAIRAAVGERLIIQITTEAVGRYEPAEQIELVKTLRPASVSLALRELVPSDSKADVEAARSFFTWLRDESIAPHYILYSAEDVRRYEAFRAEGVIPQTSPFALFVLGRYVEPAEVRVDHLLPFLDAHDQTCPWSTCAFGQVETAVSLAAASLGGHVRAGFENNLWHGDGSLASDNADLIRRIRQGADLIGRPIADIAETRAFIQKTAS